MDDPRDEALRKIGEAWDRVGSYMSAKDFVWEVQAILASYEAVTAREVEKAREQVRRGETCTEAEFRVALGIEDGGSESKTYRGKPVLTEEDRRTRDAPLPPEGEWVRELGDGDDDAGEEG